MRTHMKTVFTAAVLIAAVGCSDGDLELTSPPGENPQEPTADLDAELDLQLPAPPEARKIDLPEDAGPALKLPSIVIPGGDPLVVDDDQVECPDAGFTTIQEAVDHAAGIPGSQSVEVCEGTYTETVFVGPGNPLQIKGHGIGATKVEAPPGTLGPIILAMNAGRVDLEKVTVDGLSTMGLGIVEGITLVNTDGHLKEVEVKNIRNPGGDADGRGVNLVGADGNPWNTKLEKSRVTNFTEMGIRVEGVGQHSELKENYIEGHIPPRVNFPWGIFIARGAEAKVENNELQGAIPGHPPGGLGFAVELFCAGPTTVTGNRIWSANVGVRLLETQDAAVEGNTHRGSTNIGHLIQFVGFSANPAFGCPNMPSPTTDNIFKKNRVFASASTGIRVQGTPGAPTVMLNQLEGNETHGTGTTGLLLSNAHDNFLKANRMEDAANRGMWLTSSNMNRAEGNEVHRSGFEGIEILQSAENVLKDNKVVAAGRNGMRLRQSVLNHLEATEVKRSNTHGIRVDQSDDNTLFKNQFKESGRTGIRLFASDDNTVEENKVETSGFDGIHAFDNAEGNTFHKNGVKKSGDNSCDDDSVGAGTAGTANTWTENKGEAPDDPDGICDG